MLAGSARLPTLALYELGRDWVSGTDIGLDGTTLSFMCDSLGVEDGDAQDVLLSMESRNTRQKHTEIKIHTRVNLRKKK